MKREMTRNFCTKLAVCILLVLAVSAVCVAQTYTTPPFSADMAMTTKNGTTGTGKYYFSAPSFRLDTTSRGHTISMITDSSTKTNYMVMHTQRVYMEMNINQANPMATQWPAIATTYDPNNPCASAGKKFTCKRLGTEVINGRVCDKWQGTSDQGTDTFWMDQKLHFPMKVLDVSGVGIEFSNVKEGKQDPSLFQPPAGYRKMNMPSTKGGSRSPG